MRRMSVARPDEEGAILILVVFLTVTLVAMAALVVDVGALLDERRQLQNGADAGALAVARSCALGACNSGLADALADANARDGDSDVESVTYPAAPAKTVRVTTRTHGSNGAILPYSFGQVLGGGKGKTLHATATASWTTSAPATATAVPIAVSQCEANELVVGTYAIILFARPEGICLATHPTGNFGWLDTNCPDTYTVGVPVEGDSGHVGPKACVGRMINTDVTFPVFDTVTGKGSKNEYGIAGFLVLRLTGWRFPSESSPIPPCTSSNSCIAGTVVSYTTSGAAGVRLIK